MNFMGSEVPIEIEDKPTAVTIMRDLVEHLRDTIEALKREIARNPKSDEYRKALKVPANASLSPSKSSRVKRLEHRTHHKGTHNRRAKACSSRFARLMIVWTQSGHSVGVSSEQKIWEIKKIVFGRVASRAY
jgi:hypothetical protein